MKAAQVHVNLALLDLTEQLSLQVNSSQDELTLFGER